eukprot:8436706-Heterocapsa_arctica.AAC.1
MTTRSFAEPLSLSLTMHARRETTVLPSLATTSAQDLKRWTYPSFSMRLNSGSTRLRCSVMIE